MKIVNMFSNEVKPWVLPVVITLLIIVVILFVLVIVFRIKRKNTYKTYGLETNDKQALENEINKFRKLRNEYKNKLASINEIDTAEAKKDLQDILKQELNEYREDQLLKIDHDIEKQKNDLLKQTILETMQPLHLKLINESSIFHLPVSDEVKPFLVGKKGQTIKRLSDITNCNINVDWKSPYVEFSCPNPVDRTLAINTVKHLIKSEAFDMKAISVVYEKEKKALERECYLTGKEYLDRLNINVSNDKIYEYVGRLKYRWSFNQNALEHCYETALICESLARKFNLNPDIAKQIGFFHDIGKSIDYEKRYDHISSGIKIAKECHLPQEVLDGILKHHRTNCNEDYILLVRCADAWSAARTGARHFPNEDADQTAKIIEQKIKLIPDIISCKVVVEDKTIKIVFVPDFFTKKKYLAQKYEITQALKKDRRFNKYTVEFIEDLI